MTLRDPVRVSLLALAALAALGCSAQRHLVGLEPEPDAGRPDAALVSSDAPPAPAPGDAAPAPDVSLAADAPAPDTRRYEIAELWTEFVLITCERMQECCTPEEKRLNALAGDLSFCRSDLSNNRQELAQMQAARVVESVARGRALYRQDRVAACLTRLRGLPCGEARYQRELACEEVIEPLVPIGGACAQSSHHECIDGWCDTVACAARKADGEHCWQDPECLSRYCTGDGMGGACAPATTRARDLCAR